MPDSSAVGFMATMEGEHSMIADRLDREALELERTATEKRGEAEWHRQRAVWASEAADALGAGDDD